MGRRKKNAPQKEAWCWYCDREFDDEKVLLQHQRAKHYNCPYCPRRLNTSGGLTVHLNQVHKAEPTTIQNALPGRESFDIEIFGMVGIPEADLQEWQARKAKSGEGAGADQEGQTRTGRQRPQIFKGVIPLEVLKMQLEQHKALMSGKAPAPGAARELLGYGNAAFPPTHVPPPGYPVPPPPMAYTRPPPPFGQPAYNAPPPGYPYAVPPPGMGPNGAPLPPPHLARPPPNFSQPPPGFAPPNLQAPPPARPQQPPPNFGNSASPSPGPGLPARPPPAFQQQQSNAHSPQVGNKRELDPSHDPGSSTKRSRPDDDPSTTASSSSPNPAVGGRPGRTRASDLF